MTTVDWIILLIIALYAFSGLRRGFVATVANTFGSILSLIAALAAASSLKQPVGAMIAPYTKGSIAESMPELTQAVNSVDETWNNISGYLQGILSTHGISLEMLQSSKDPQQTLTDALAQSVGETIAYILVFVVVFLAARILIRFFESALGIFAHLPVIHSFNSLLGFGLGALTGLIICTSVLWALKLFVPTVYSDVGFLSPSVMEDSSIARTLVGWNDGVSIFETAPAES